MYVFSWLFVHVCTLRSAHLLFKPQRPELLLLAEPKVPSAGSLPVLQPFLKKKKQTPGDFFSFFAVQV